MVPWKGLYDKSMRREFFLEVFLGLERDKTLGVQAQRKISLLPYPRSRRNVLDLACAPRLRLFQ